MNAKLQRTKNYAQFSFAKQNRPVDLLNISSGHKKLRASMEKYGFLPSCPIMVDSQNGRFVIKDGQHRFTFAHELGLEVYFVVDETNIDIAEINAAQSGWSMRDYANRWANEGRKDYTTALQFADQYRVPVGTAFAMLCGTISFSNMKLKFRDGQFKINNISFSTRVAKCYADLCAVKKGVRHDNLVAAIWACCHVPYFEESRILETVRRRPELMTSCGTTESFLQMLGEIYNYGRKVRQPIAFDAQEESRQRAGFQKK